MYSENSIKHNLQVNSLEGDKNYSAQQIEDILDQEMNENKNENWSKMTKTNKVTILNKFHAKFTDDNNLNEDEKSQLYTLLHDALDKKRIQKVKDIVYDKEKGEIINIPGLQIKTNQFETRVFSMKLGDGHTSTLKNLPPKRKKLTVKNKNKKEE